MQDFSPEKLVIAVMLDVQETAAAKDQLAALENRHAEFLKLEASIKEVHSMFLDMHQLVEMQGDLVGRIEDHVNSAVVDVERGRADLGKAENFKKGQFVNIEADTGKWSEDLNKQHKF